MRALRLHRRTSIQRTAVESWRQRGWRDFRSLLTLPNFGGALILILCGPAIYWWKEGTEQVEGQVAGWLWSGLVPLVGLLVLALLWSLAAAPYRLACDRANALEAQVGVLQSLHATELADLSTKLNEARRQIDVMNATPVPNLSFADPHVATDVPMVSGSTQTFVFGRVVNNQSSPGKGLTAQRAHLTMTYFDLDGNVLAGPFPGKWRDAASSLQLSPLQIHTDAAALDLHANGAIYEFDLVTRTDDGNAFGIDASQNAYSLDRNRVRVTVELRGVNFPTLTDYYLIYNVPGDITVVRDAGMRTKEQSTP